MVRMFLCVVLLCMPVRVHAQEIRLDADAARQVLEALQDPELELEAALRIASLEGNRALIHKENSYGNGEVDEDVFARELVATARGQASEGNRFRFDQVKRDRDAIAVTVDAILADPEQFVGWSEQRISAFAPPGVEPELRGFLVAGGRASGFAFGTPEFFLNIAHFAGQPGTARLSFAHELYHGLQGYASKHLPVPNPDRRFNEEKFGSMVAGPERDSYLINAFLTLLLTEGAAIYVGDPALIEEKGGMATFERDRFDTQLARLDRLATQLDLSLTGLVSTPPVDFGAIYAFGFYGPDQPLYFLGYEMVRRIVAEQGAAKIAELINADGCTFARTYIGLAGSKDYVPLGAQTLHFVDRHCP